MGKDEKDIVDSYLSLRRLIGILGMALPVVCLVMGALFGSTQLQSSISYYYYSNARDIFVGILVCVGFFLITYRGYEKIDNIITTASGIFCLCIPFFPCAGPLETIGIFQLPANVSNVIHLSTAVVFFLLLAFNSIFLFTKTSETEQMTTQKVQRNIVYVACGAVMLVSLVIVAVLMILLPPEEIDDLDIVYWAEFVMLVAFGFSWLVKGNTLLKDDETVSAAA